MSFFKFNNQSSNHSTSFLIAPLGDISMFNIHSLTMHKVHMRPGAIRQLLHGCAHVREIIHSLTLMDYPPVYTHKPYNNLHSSLSLVLQVFKKPNVSILKKSLS